MGTYHQSIQEIIDAADPAQKLMWNYIFLTYGEKIAVSQFYIPWFIMSSEIGVFTARKMYFLYELTLMSHGTTLAAARNLQLYDPSNNSVNFLARTSIAWNATTAAINYMESTASAKNLLIGRVNGDVALRAYGIGFRINY
jgi:hypothetical protein